MRFAWARGPRREFPWRVMVQRVLASLVLASTLVACSSGGGSTPESASSGCQAAVDNAVSVSNDSNSTDAEIGQAQDQTLVACTTVADFSAADSKYWTRP